MNRKNKIRNQKCFVHLRDTNMNLSLDLDTTKEKTTCNLNCIDCEVIQKNTEQSTVKQIIMC